MRFFQISTNEKVVLQNKKDYAKWKRIKNCTQKWCWKLCAFLFEVTWVYGKMCLAKDRRQILNFSSHVWGWTCSVDMFQGMQTFTQCSGKSNEHLKNWYYWPKELLLFKNNLKKKKDVNDRDRTRTCNPQIRSLMPYPLGHTATVEINSW